MKTPLLKSLFNKVAGLKVCNFFKKETPTQLFSCKYWENFKNTHFEKDLRTTASVSRIVAMTPKIGHITSKKLLHLNYI